MKTKFGLISNSSTTSFLIYGACLEADRIRQLLLTNRKAEIVEVANRRRRENEEWKVEYRREHPEYANEDWLKPTKSEPYTEDNISEFLEDPDSFGNFLPTVGAPDWSDGIYMGYSWASIKDDETGAQFKARIKKELSDALGEEIACGTLEEAWRDG